MMHFNTPSNRRQFLKAGMLAASGAVLSQVTFAKGPAPGRARFVLVLMRGALDGLAAVPACGDPAYPGLRRDLTLEAPGNPGGALALDGFFGLHPALRFLHESYLAHQLVVFQAVATPYRERSHVDGQDVLESGLTQPHAAQTGWLNRALSCLPGPAGNKNNGLALGANVPLVLRGPAGVSAWSPSTLATLDDETLARIADMYTADPLLASRLAEALAASTLLPNAADSAMDPGGEPADPDAGPAGSNSPMDGEPARAPRAYEEVVRATARFLGREDGPQVAVFDTRGWDTHAGQGGARGPLAGRLRALDAGLAVLKTELGARWADTAVLLVTEFGRTAAINGTHGTDHGTASCAFLLGGAVRGGRVVADWPGLGPSGLYQGRDVRATLDLRAVLKGVLHEHLRAPEDALTRTVFPGSEGVKARTGLLRA